MITDPGIYTLSSLDYHADPCIEPSLSASIAKILIQQSPLHAKDAHPRLTPNATREEAAHLDLGTLCHALMLEGEDVAHVITATKSEGTGKNKVDTGEPVTDYRTKAAQQERDDARAAGKCPILAHEMPGIQRMMAACREQLATHADASDAFTKGKPEQTLVWQEFNGVWCRCRVDWLHDSYLIADDYKTGEASCHPDMVSKNMSPKGWDITAAFYLRGIKAVCGTDAKYRFICQENFSPFALSVATCSASKLDRAADQVQYAIEQWGKCLQSGIWPGYPTFTYAAELLPWEENAWLAKRAQEEEF